MAAAHAALAQTACKVVDAELQESYSGPCVGGYAEGRGEARGRAIYRGEFKEGRKHGTGVKTWPLTGDRYEGDFVADRREGTGTYTWGPRSVSPGERYSGGYRADLRQGYGVYEWPSGDRYAGPWVDDAPTGPLTKGMIARARAQAAHAAAVGIAGVRVCRDLPVGIATMDTIRGTVIGRDGETIRVRIDHAGNFEHVLGERAVRSGDVLRDPLRNWIRCG